MKKIEFIRMWQSRVSDGETNKYTQNELIELLDTFIDTMKDAFEYTLEKGEYIKFTNDVRVSVKERPERVYSGTTLKHIITGEPIEVEGRIVPAKKMLVLHGFEKDA